MEFDVNRYLEQENEITLSKEIAKKLVSIIDLTTLNPDDTEENIINLCEKATTQLGNVAAVCVYPKFVAIVNDQLKSTDIRIASVANFPSGSEKLKDSLKQIETALKAGANEIDLVLPYEKYLQGETEFCFDYIKECRNACSKQVLKVILEISEFPKLDQVYQVCQELMLLDVDFLKTSTGKSRHGANLECATVMLLAIKDAENHTGFKASGGIKTVEQACGYLSLAQKIMGDKWVTAEHFRIGASSLLDEILARSNEL